jgi:acyl carrier protein
MVPAAFVMLPALPLTPNGKVDRKALPQPVASQGADFGILRDAPTQDILAAVWQQLLGIRTVGPDDNFFELGGDSLMALKMSSLLQDRASIHLPVRMIFEFPTLSALSQQIIAQPGEINGPNVIAITPELISDAGTPATEDRPDMAKIIAKQRSYLDHWQGHRMAPDSLIVTLNENGTRRGLFWCLQGHHELSQFAIHLGPDQPVHGLRSGHLVMEYTWETVSMLAAHYVAEMIKIQPHGDFVIGGNCQGGLITQTVANQLKALGRNVSLLILMEQSTFYEYDGDVALIFGKNSFLNPYKDESEEDPDAMFARSYRSYTVDFIDGAHGEFFSPPNVESLMQIVRQSIYGNRKAALAIA